MEIARVKVEGEQEHWWVASQQSPNSRWNNLVK